MKRALFVIALLAVGSPALANCNLPNGQPVPIAYDNTLPMPAMSQKSIHNEWRVVINQSLFSRYPAIMQAFIMRHECGHLYLNHTGMGILQNEFAADCWAMRSMRGQGLSGQQASFIVNNMYQESPELRVRADALRNC